MFVEAIESVAKFTTPIHMITRSWGGLLTPGSATLFFVNEEGCAITCRHTADAILNAEKLNARYQSFRSERALLPHDNRLKQHLTRLEAKYGYKKETTIQEKINFINSVDLADGKLTIHLHPVLDLAILKFEGFKTKYYSSCATFVRDAGSIKQGKSLCRLGYPFPEFTNFRYNQDTDDIEWTAIGNPDSPRFPMEGMLTRFIGDGQQVVSIEMSTPGLRGQSGGPLFDKAGVVYGMQAATGHLHLGFDIRDMQIIQNGRPATISNSPFLHVGHCIHVERIKEFLRNYQIKFYETD